MTSIEQEAGIFGGLLTIYAHRQKLPRSLFEYPDHAVIEAASTEDFARLAREEVAPRSTEMLCAQTDWRFQAAAKLKGKIAIYDLGLVDWVIVEEPKRKTSRQRVQRAEFYFDSLETAINKLRDRGLRARITPEKNRAYVGVRFDDSGLEFRITDTPLADVTEAQLDCGEAIIVDLSPQRTTWEIADIPDDL